MCGTIEKQLIHYLYGELTPEESLEVSRHLETCNNCRKEFEALQMTVGILSKWQDITPAQELRDKLFKRISRESWSWWVRIGNYILTANLALKTVFSVVFGVLSAFLSVFIITRYVTPTHLSPESLLICGIVWSGAYIALFGLALNRKGSGVTIKGVKFDLTHLARGALVSIAIATTLVSVSLCLVLETSQVSNFKALFGTLFGEFHRGFVYFSAGSVLALASLFTGSLILKKGSASHPFVHCLLATCLFTLAIAPGLTVICIPFTLGIYLSLLSGSGFGALLGSTVGFLLFRKRWQYNSL